jgi:hypothetical protein
MVYEADLDSSLRGHQLVGKQMGFAAISAILGIVAQPIKDYFSYKQKVTETNRELELARISAEKDAIVSGNVAQTSQIDYYLKAINRNFRQGFICFIVIPFFISMLAPEYAKLMWHNFEAMPEWYRMLLLSVCSLVLGLPVASAAVGQMFSSASKGLEARRNYKLEKARINREAVYASLRASEQFKGRGIDQATVDVLEAAMDAGER